MSEIPKGMTPSRQMAGHVARVANRARAPGVHENKEEIEQRIIAANESLQRLSRFRTFT
jgi:hypothetical protein